MITFLGGMPLYVPNLEAFWRDPRPFEAERAREQAKVDALFAEHDAKWRAEQAKRWEDEE